MIGVWSPVTDGGTLLTYTYTRLDPRTLRCEWKVGSVRMGGLVTLLGRGWKAVVCSEKHNTCTLVCPKNNQSCGDVGSLHGNVSCGTVGRHPHG